MKVSKLKAKLDEIFEEHGDIDVVSSAEAPNDDTDPNAHANRDYLEFEPYKLEPTDIRLGWVKSDWKRLTARPSNPLTDQIVLVILDD